MISLIVYGIFINPLFAKNSETRNNTSIMEQNQRNPKFVPFSGCKKLKIDKIMEQNQRNPKFVPFLACKNT